MAIADASIDLETKCNELLAIGLPSRTAGLDVLRFGAASLVMMLHLVAAPSIPTTIIAKIIDGAFTFPELASFQLGWIGVQIFFVISGIVISYSAATASPRKFLRSRILRLYPAVWLCATISAIVLWSYAIVPIKQIARGYIHSILLIPVAPWIDEVYWTLGVEMVFYAMVWIILAFSSFERIKTLCWIIGGVSAAFWIGGALFKPSFLTSHMFDRRLSLTLIHHGVFFSLGILLFLNNWHRRNVIFAGVLLVAAAIQIVFHNQFAEHLFERTQSPVFPLAIFLVSLVAAYVSIRWPINSSQTLYMIGLATYPLYLVHYLYGAALLKFLGVNLAINRIVAVGITVMICIVTSLVLVLAERPIRRRLGAILEKYLALS